MASCIVTFFLLLIGFASNALFVSGGSNQLYGQDLSSVNPSLFIHIAECVVNYEALDDFNRYIWILMTS